MTGLTEELHVAAQCMLGTVQLTIERQRQLWKLRSDVRRLEHDLAVAKAALEVEEREQERDGSLVREMFEQWKADLRTEREAGGQT